MISAIGDAFRDCCLGLLASVYLCNEHCTNKRKHYRLFQRWFEPQGSIPLAMASH